MNTCQHWWPNTRQMGWIALRMSLSHLGRVATSDHCNMIRNKVTTCDIQRLKDSRPSHRRVSSLISELQRCHIWTQSCERGAGEWKEILHTPGKQQQQQQHRGFKIMLHVTRKCISFNWIQERKTSVTHQYGEIILSNKKNPYNKLFCKNIIIYLI